MCDSFFFEPESKDSKTLSDAGVETSSIVSNEFCDVTLPFFILSSEVGPRVPPKKERLWVAAEGENVDIVPRLTVGLLATYSSNDMPMFITGSLGRRRSSMGGGVELLVRLEYIIRFLAVWG